MHTTNHFMPFLWIHGESEETYREMIRAIDEANMKVFCVEARPHNEFLEEKWWQDVDIILDEAKKRDMKFYILDDKHFPTGYANGTVEHAPMWLRRQSIFCKSISVQKNVPVVFRLMDYSSFEPTCNPLGQLMNQYLNSEVSLFNDDSLYSATYYDADSFIPLEKYVEGDKLKFTPPDDGEIRLLFLTRNAGIHRNYINMLEEDSVRLLIDEVYEKHYQHYKEEFGETILGFFSDEPELGNSSYTNRDVDMGVDPNLDLCWSATLDQHLLSAIGDNYKNMLPLLWKRDFAPNLTSRIRYQFMSTLTDLVSECFSKQIGTWCQEHGVEYIGHVIEDNNLHSKTCSSLGHYFKGLKYQTMAGIDNIGGQVIPFRDDVVEQDNPLAFRDGVFYHYCLGKLGASLGQINPRMHGRSMCEIFGNYGWSEGIRLEKYLLDHFMVRGINYFVPHAFTCSPYPDPDCPPHFYAHGNHPQYRHFGKLMKYGERICSMISGGRPDIKVAILYHAESEWCGERMLIQDLAKELYDYQIDYAFLPAEIFEQMEFYRTQLKNQLIVNGNSYDLFLIAECDRIPGSVVSGIKILREQGCQVAFINRFPQGTCEGENLPDAIFQCDMVPLEDLASFASSRRSVTLAPDFNRIRCLHYYGNEELYFIVNEGKTPYNGELALPCETPVTLYDAFLDTYSMPNYRIENGITRIKLFLPSCGSLIILPKVMDVPFAPSIPSEKQELRRFSVTTCRAIDYPDFMPKQPDENFSGYVSYETEVKIQMTTERFLIVEDAFEGVEVFINGISKGIQIIPPFVYNISDCLKSGNNTIRIEVASTLQQERRKDVPQMVAAFGGEFTPDNPDPVGITGKVWLCCR